VSEQAGTQLWEALPQHAVGALCIQGTPTWGSNSRRSMTAGAAAAPLGLAGRPPGAAGAVLGPCPGSTGSGSANLIREARLLLAVEVLA
jgi:hypothetical protein